MRHSLSILHSSFSIALAAVCATVAMSASATVVWEKGSWATNATDHSFLVDAEHGNLVRGKLGQWTHANPPTDADRRFTNGQATPNSGSDNNPASDVGVPINNNTSLTFNFGSPKTIREVRIYACWKDTGREKISVASVSVTDGVLGATTVISPEAIYQWDAGAGTSNYAFLKDDQGGDIASYVSSITINFGAQQNNYVGYAEIEVLGADDTTTRLLNITGNPSTGGEASPAYGLYFPDDMDGRTLSATPVVTNADESVIWTCTGWKTYVCNDVSGNWVFDDTIANAQGSGTSFTFSNPGDVRLCKVEWQWDTVYRIEVSATSGGSATALPQAYYPAGTELTVTATPDDPDALFLWTGDIPLGADPSVTSMTFTVDGPVSLVANFSGLIWVDDDAAAGGDGSSTAPFQTVDAALAAASSGGVVVVRPGSYQLSSTQTLSSGIKVLGSTDNYRDVVIAAPSGSRRVFTLSNASVLVRGVTLRGTGGAEIAVAYVSSGTLENCRVTGGCSPRGGQNNLGGGAGVANDGGTVRRCVIDGCTAGGNIYAGLGLRQTAGLTEYCVITNNSFGTNHGAAGHPCSAGAYVSGGVLRGCLIARNSIGRMSEGTSDFRNAMALYLVNDVTVDGCAIVENTITSAIDSGRPTAAIYCSGKETIVNTIIQNNTDSTGTDFAIAGDPLIFNHNLTQSTINGAGNVTEVLDTYEWTEDGEFALNSASVAIDGAEPLDGVSYKSDLYGHDRVTGFGMDIGPAECQSLGDAAVIIRVDSLTVTFPASSRFTAGLIGFPETGVTYSWEIDGVEVSTAGTFDKTWEAPGVYEVSVTATAGNLSASSQATISVLSKDIFLDASCATPSYPYASRATAATSFEDIRSLIAYGGSLTVYPGTYTATVTISLPSVYEIRGVGDRDAIVIQRDALGPLLQIASPDIYLHGLTLKGGGSANGATLNLSGGALVEDVNLFGGVPGRNGGGGGCLLIGNATIRNSTIGNVTSGNDINFGLGVKINAGALVENCIITNVVCTYLHYAAAHAQGVAVHISGGTLRNCLVADNHILGGHTGDQGVNGRMYAAGVYQNGGTIENCTITDNTSVEGPAGYCRNGNGTMANGIVYGNTNAENEGEPSDDANIAGTASSVMNHCWTSDPRFRLGGNGVPKYSLRSSSPCVNAGASLSWMNGATDLAGNPRVFGKAVDIGCYECQFGGATVFIVR